MGKITVNFSIFAMFLLLGTSMANSQELHTGSQAATPGNIDIESFRQELSRVSSAEAQNQGAELLRGRVKTLNTRYLISPGDTIALSVYGEPDFAQPEILVRPDGYATIEPFGEMNIAGVDIDNLTSRLREKFKNYLLDPKISVKLTNMHTAKVYIYGAVQKPGLYQQERIDKRDVTTGRVITVIPEMTVASVIANAGGIKYDADLRHVKITNNETGKDSEVNLMRMLETGDTSQDVFLRSGDSIYIPSVEGYGQISDRDFTLISSSSIAPAEFPVRVIGAVNRPGSYNLTSASPRLNSAIAQSEGFTLYANKNVVTVQRLTPQGNISTFYVNPAKNDLILRPNDIVIVPDKTTAVASRGMEFATNVFRPFGGFADAFLGWAEIFDPEKYRRYR